MGAEELQDPENVSKIWVKSFCRIVNNEQKMNNTKLLMVDMKSNDAIKLDTVKLEEEKLLNISRRKRTT